MTPTYAGQDRAMEIRAPMDSEYEQILTTPAADFIVELTRRFRPRVDEALDRREAIQARFDAGERPDWYPETADIRASEWTVEPVPGDLQKRWVEITGPVERKMIINALNSGADLFMADFEDSSAPTWRAMMDGQVNLRDAVAGTIQFEHPKTGKQYRLADDIAVLIVRPRGWHLWEHHIIVDDRPIPGALLDFGLHFFNNATPLLNKDSGPYFYLPKMEHYLEARLWNDVFIFAQDYLGIPHSTIKATALIETVPAAFQMDEILWELRQHSAGLNCGRWDYIFSFIKIHRNHPNTLLPDRAQFTMTQPCMRAYTQLVIKTCHRRNIHAMGGMSPFIPIKDDPEANERVLEKVRADKLREVRDGHDGTWVAHPGLVSVAREIFESHLDGPNQIHRKREDFHTTADELLAIPEGTRTEEALRHDVRVGIYYLEAWFNGVGSVALYHLMEDAATAEISRSQIWNWIQHAAVLDTGKTVTTDLVRRIIDEEMEVVRKETGDERFNNGRFNEARDLFQSLCTSDTLETWLTLPAYEHILEQ